MREAAPADGKVAIATSLILRMLQAVLVVIAIGLPINQLYEYFLFAGAIFAVSLGIPRLGLARYIGAVVFVAISVIAADLLPRASIEEGHNVVLFDQGKAAFEKALPAEVVAELERRFHLQYPPENWCRKRGGCWRGEKEFTEAFAFAADSIWRPALFSRVVDRIGFTDLRSFRGGFVNDKRHNWYDGVSDIRRDSMPFFVMYELSPQSVGSTLCWRGSVMWEIAPERFESNDHDEMTCRPITHGDAGHRVFGLAIEQHPGLAMELRLSRNLWLADIARRVAPAVAVVAVLLLTVSLRFKGDRRNAAALVLGGFAIALAFEIAGSDVFGRYAPFWGGNDGLTHEGNGRILLQAALQGDWWTAMRGNESVYYHMPGLRYARALGAVFFGDTTLGYFTVLLALPGIVYALLRTVLSPRPALIAGIVFLVFPATAHFAFSFISYGALYREGLAELLGNGAFFAALALYLRAASGKTEDFLALSLAANIAFAVAIWARPNLVPGAAIFLSIMFLHCMQVRCMRRFLIGAIGLTPIVLIPLHNYVYGDVFVPLTRASTIEANLKLSPAIYYEGLLELLSGNTAGENIRRVLAHLYDWSNPHTKHSSWIGFIPSVLVFAGLATALFSRKLSNFNLRALALTALAQQAVLLFWFPNKRYAMLAWGLSYIVTFGVLERLWRRRMPETTDDARLAT